MRLSYFLHAEWNLRPSPFLSFPPLPSDSFSPLPLPVLFFLFLILSPSCARVLSRSFPGTSFLNGKGHTSDTGFGRRPSLPSHGASQTAGARGLSADPRNGSMMSRGRRSSTTNLGAGGGAGGSGLGGGSGRGKLNTAGCGNVEIYFARRCSTPHAPCNMLYVVHTLIGR